MGQFTSSSSNRKDRSLPTTEPTPKSISSDTERSTASMPRSDSARFTSASQSHKPKHSYSNSTPRAGAPSVISEASSARTGTGTASSMTAPARRHTEAAFSTTNTTRPPTVKRTDSNTLRQKPSRRPSTRKPALIRRPTFQTEYMDMLLHLDTIPRLHNIYASAFGWILLAGFLVLPGTFASLKDREAELDADKGNKAQIEAEVLHAVNNVPLLAIAIACCAIGGIGLFWLWMVWRRNYVWSLNRIFLYVPISFYFNCLETGTNSLITTMTQTRLSQLPRWRNLNLDQHLHRPRRRIQHHSPRHHCRHRRLYRRALPALRLLQFHLAAACQESASQGG